MESKNFNFNFSHQNEYKLNRHLIDELITHYGVPIKFLLTEKINYDKHVFGDFSHMKSDKDKIWDMYALPETSETFDIESYNYTPFGFNSFENCNLFVSKKIFDEICTLDKIVGNLIVLPNNKTMEITNCEFMVPGINNLYTYNDEKSVYKLSCRPYEFKVITEVRDDTLVNTPEVVDYETSRQTAKDDLEKEIDLKHIEDDYNPLDKYFEELTKVKHGQDVEAEVVPASETVEKDTKEDKDITVKKPLRDMTEDDVFGQY